MRFGWTEYFDNNLALAAVHVLEVYLKRPTLVFDPAGLELDFEHREKARERTRPEVYRNSFPDGWFSIIYYG